MALKLNDHYLQKFIRPQEYANMQPAITAAHELLVSRQGPGNDFLGWVDLPQNYDKEEFARIKAAAEKIHAKFERAARRTASPGSIPMEYELIAAAREKYQSDHSEQTEGA